MNFDDLYARYSGIVFHACIKYLKNEEDAVDATQDVFVKVMERFEQFQNRSQLTTWVYRIAVNHCLDVLRTERRRESILDIRKDEVFQQEFVNGLEDTEHKMTVEKLLVEEDDFCREIVDLHYFQGHNHGEISKKFGVSRVTITKKINEFKKNALLKYFQVALFTVLLSSTIGGVL